MSESSFDREFHITDLPSAKQLQQDLEDPQAVRYAKRDLLQDEKKGIELLRKKFDAQKIATPQR
ncbi:MAG: hypothetical protein ACI832_000546 [Rheinheimera aquimaris]|jgi:hypothetical protein|uniref:hypothetical protein n=1 Tax=Rheinheimera aquimaris TaxID=412437 RepID=UPI000E7D5431|nr:hypothetical protein [Rheinheimera sp.]|tara:strand:- start:32 stop:223 length:192 start_codon:yes stop_codon:yes gene_type:complete